MKRLRLVLVTALAAASLGVGAAPAAACQPEGPCPPCDWTTPADGLWTKVFGHKVFHC